MRAAIYARVSTKDQSCEMQLRDLRTYCTVRGFTVTREYIDSGQSGANDRNHPTAFKLSGCSRKNSPSFCPW